MMDYTDRERHLAKALAEPEMMRLLEKVLQEKYAAEETTEQNVLALSNERYGEIMKVNFMVRQHVKGALGRIRQLSKTTSDTPTPARAPR